MKTHRHLYYSDPEAIDLNKLRADAEVYVKGDYRNPPADSVTIHHHRKTDQCPGRKHEYFAPADSKP